jgi:hypothetical protein
MSVEQFVCGTENCGYAIASEGLNHIQLKALRVWKKTCPNCGKQTLWVEQTSLLNTQTTTKKPMEGKRHAKAKKPNINDQNRTH